VIPDRAKSDGRYGLAQCDNCRKKRFDAARTNAGRTPSAAATAAEYRSDFSSIARHNWSFGAGGSSERAFRRVREHCQRAIDKPPQANEALLPAGVLSASPEAVREEPRDLRAFSQIWLASEFQVPVAELDAQNLFSARQVRGCVESIRGSWQRRQARSQAIAYCALRVAQVRAFRGATSSNPPQLLTSLASDPRAWRRMSSFSHRDLFCSAMAQAPVEEPSRGRPKALSKFITLTKGETFEAKFKLALALLGADDASARPRKFSVICSRASERIAVGCSGGW